MYVKVKYFLRPVFYILPEISSEALRKYLIAKHFMREKSNKLSHTYNL